MPTELRARDTGPRLRGRGGITADEAANWAAEQSELGERGEFFFACTQFCFTATR